MKAALPTTFRAILLISLVFCRALFPDRTVAQDSQSRPSAAFTLADLKAQIPQNEKGQFILEVPQMVNAAIDGEVFSLLSGQLVESTGQIAYQAGETGNAPQPVLARSQIQCCVTHAREYFVALRFPGDVKAPRDRAWVRLIGNLSSEVNNGRVRAVCVVTEIQEIEVPGNPLLK